MSGGVVTSFYGGYDSVEAQKVTLGMAWFCVVVAIPIPWVTNFTLFGTLVWLLMFFGGAIMAPLTGLMLILVDENLRGSASSISQFSYNAFGYLPAPIVYGFFSYLIDKDHAKKKSHIPLMIIIYTVFGTALLTTFTIRRKHAVL